MAFRAAAQDRGVAGLQAQRAGIGRHVGPALVDDADDAQGHAHALDLEAVGPRPVGDHRADRIGAAAAISSRPLAMPSMRAVVQRQAVQERAGTAAPLAPQRDRARWPPGWRRCRRAALAAAASRALFLAAVRASASARAAARARAPIARIVSSTLRCASALSAGCRHVLLNTMSSRCTSSVRPAWPRMAAISPLLLPMIRAASPRA